MRDKPFRYALLLLGLLLALAACGGSDQPDDDPEPEDGDASDGDTDPPVDGDLYPNNPASGHWELEDSNAFKWFQAEGLTGLSLVVGSRTMDFVLSGEEGSRCVGFELRPLGDTGRYAPASDPDTCWYQFEVNHAGKLELYARHAEDPAGVERPWYFIFRPVARVPGYEAAACDRGGLCIHYAVTD